MKTDLMRDTEELFALIRDNQQEMADISDAVIALCTDYDELVSQQKGLIRKAMVIVGDNERLYRDSFHILELSKNLNKRERAELQKILKVAVEARRETKDLLRELGLPNQEATAVLSGGVKTIAKTPPDKFPVYASSVEVNQALKTASGRVIKKGFVEKAKPVPIPANRVYRVRSPKDSVGGKIISDFLDGCTHPEEKLSDIIYEGVERDG